MSLFSPAVPADIESIHAHPIQTRTRQINYIIDDVHFRVKRRSALTNIISNYFHKEQMLFHAKIFILAIFIIFDKKEV